jgi:hypothetical protein
MAYTLPPRVVFALVFAGSCAHPPPLAPAAATAPAPVDPRWACTQVMGVSVTGDWFGHGFEDGLDGERWQAITRKHAFVELWGDPASDLWALPPVSPCATRSNDPDRVLFTAVNWQYKTTDEWSGALTKVVETLRQKYPGLRRIELLTMLRGPGNQSCGDYRTVVQPYVDEAAARVAAARPDLVRVGPKVEATCDLFTKGGPHFTEPGMAGVARIYRTHYLDGGAR